MQVLPMRQHWIRWLREFLRSLWMACGFLLLVMIFIYVIYRMEESRDDYYTKATTESPRTTTTVKPTTISTNGSSPTTPTKATPSVISTPRPEVNTTPSTMTTSRVIPINCNQTHCALDCCALECDECKVFCEECHAGERLSTTLRGLTGASVCVEVSELSIIHIMTPLLFNSTARVGIWI